MLDAVRGGVASVSQTLQEFERAREVSQHGAELASARLLPWRTLGEQFSILEATLQERVLRVSVAANFSPELARVQRPGEPKQILPGCLPMAQASLEADPALSAMRYRLVPATLTEEDFWRCYFWKVANIKCELLNDFASTNRARRAAVLADDAALEPDAVRQGQDANAAVAPPAQDDGFVELTVDAEFERLVGVE